MTITQMQYFAAVCEYGTISRAAEMLHVSQPSISLAIKDLEEQFGTVLFNRETKRLQLTQEGTYMHESVKSILAQINALEVQMSDMGRRQKQLSIAIPVLTGMMIHNQFLNDFHDHHPDISYTIRQCNSEQAFSQLVDGGCDAAIIVDGEKIPKNLEKVPLLTSEFVFCVQKDHPLAKRVSVRLEDIKNQPIILNQENSYMSKVLKRRFYNAGFVPDILMYGAQLSLIHEIVSSGKAASFLIKELAAEFPDMVMIPLEDPIPITFSLVWMKGKSQNKKAQVLIDYIRSRT